jgi:hypothetical protein
MTKMKRAYKTLLWLYPADYRALFAAEMLHTFEKAAEECRARRPGRFVKFVFAELVGLVTGAAAEWIAKLTTDASVRGRCLSRQDKVADTEKRIAITIEQMVHAIANHDFPKARFYSDREREKREQLLRLRSVQASSLD